MKTWIVLALAFFSTAPALAETIPASQASAHVGQTVTVEGTATTIYTSRNGTTFIDVDGRYPNQAFVAVIFKSVLNVGDLSALQGKTVDISGTVKLYEGKAEIVVTARDQIKP